jgi:polysaccharide export outer membrane protein
MKPSLRLVFALVALVCAVACSKSTQVRGSLPAPTMSTTVGPGDLFEVSVLGEKDLPKEYRVQPDGTVEFPYLERLMVAGLEPQQIEDLIKTKLVEAKVLVAPTVGHAGRQAVQLEESKHHRGGSKAGQPPVDRGNAPYRRDLARRGAHVSG